MPSTCQSLKANTQTCTLTPLHLLHDEKKTKKIQIHYPYPYPLPTPTISLLNHPYTKQNPTPISEI